VAAGVGGLPGAAAARRVTRRPHRARGGARATRVGDRPSDRRVMSHRRGGGRTRRASALPPAALRLRRRRWEGSLFAR
jgi:hypothetical protein